MPRKKEKTLAELRADAIAEYDAHQRNMQRSPKYRAEYKRFIARATARTKRKFGI